MVKSFTSLDNIALIKGSFLPVRRQVVGVRVEVVPFLIVALVVGVVVSLACKLCGVGFARTALVGGITAFILICYFIYFFRDPERISPVDESVIVAGADGTVAKIVEIREDEHLKTDVVRISIFLSLFDVHVNRAPIAGKSTFLGYFKGRHMFTFNEKSSDVNQHNKILIKGDKTSCLLTQIVGPVCRRVVYWPDHDTVVALNKGDRIGMMKFGSRMDMYFPKNEIEVTCKVGDKTQAGVTVIGKIREGAGL